MVLGTMIQVVEDTRSKSHLGMNCILDVSGRIVCVLAPIPKTYLWNEL